MLPGAHASVGAAARIIRARARTDRNFNRGPRRIARAVGPAAATWIGAVLMVIGSDLCGRAEEKMLASAFGSPYPEYCARTRRFVPGIY